MVRYCNMMRYCKPVRLDALMRQMTMVMMSMWRCLRRRGRHKKYRTQ
jgi:hypothetical protein